MEKVDFGKLYAYRRESLLQPAKPYACFELTAYYGCYPISQLCHAVGIIAFVRYIRTKQVDNPHPHASFLAFAPRSFGAGLSFFTR